MWSVLDNILHNGILQMNIFLVIFGAILAQIASEYHQIQGKRKIIVTTRLLSIVLYSSYIIILHKLRSGEGIMGYLLPGVLLIIIMSFIIGRYF